MSVYLDASVLVPLFVTESTTPRVEAWLAGPGDFVLSSWTLAEISSGLSHRQRTERLTPTERDAAEAEVDNLAVNGPPMVEIADSDVAVARNLLRLDPILRTPDALHLAVVLRLDAALATYDGKLTDAAKALGLEVIAP